MRPRGTQLELFSAKATQAPPTPFQRATAETATRLPALLHLGSSSWTFPGWKALIYRRQYRDASHFRAESLSEYAAEPLFRCVSVDSAFYAAPSPDRYAAYAAQLRADFKLLPKVWSGISQLHLGGAEGHAAQRNPSFCDASRFAAEVIAPYMDGVPAAHRGPLLLQLSPAAGLDFGTLRAGLARLAAFVDLVPIAVELRNPELYHPGYFGLLRELRLLHVFSYRAGLPDLETQRVLCPPVSQDMLVMRLMLAPQLDYMGAKTRFEPFDRRQLPQAAMHASAQRILREALGASRPCFAMASNKAEGCAPETLHYLARCLIEA